MMIWGAGTGSTAGGGAGGCSACLRMPAWGAGRRGGFSASQAGPIPAWRPGPVGRWTRTGAACLPGITGSPPCSRAEAPCGRRGIRRTAGLRSGPPPSPEPYVTACSRPVIPAGSPPERRGDLSGWPLLTCLARPGGSGQPPASPGPVTRDERTVLPGISSSRGPPAGAAGCSRAGTAGSATGVGAGSTATCGAGCSDQGPGGMGRSGRRPGFRAGNRRRAGFHDGARAGGGVGLRAPFRGGRGPFRDIRPPRGCGRMTGSRFGDLVRHAAAHAAGRGAAVPVAAGTIVSGGPVQGLPGHREDVVGQLGLAGPGRSRVAELRLGSWRGRPEQAWAVGLPEQDANAAPVPEGLGTVGEYPAQVAVSRHRSSSRSRRTARRCRGRACAAASP